jgi:hypothetical protein
MALQDLEMKLQITDLDSSSPGELKNATPSPEPNFPNGEFFYTTVPETSCSIAQHLQTQCGVMPLILSVFS